MLPYIHTGKSTANEHGGMSKHTKEESIRNKYTISITFSLAEMFTKASSYQGLSKNNYGKISVCYSSKKQKATSEVLLAVNRLRQDQTNNYKQIVPK